MLRPPRKATPHDTDDIIALRLYSEEWLHAAGIDQWHDTQRGIRNIRDGINAGETWIVDDPEGGAAGTLTLGGSDPDFWSAKESRDSLYLYKFMVGPKWRGTGLGDELLDWACAQAQKAGKLWLRLDCWRSNRALQGYYRRRGFRHVRTVVVEGRGSGALFERSAKTRMGSNRCLMAGRA